MASTQQFDDVAVAARVHTERQRFISSIADRDVLRLASSHHPSKASCTFFQPTVHGSYNICYFIQFDDRKERWVVRIPIQPCLTHGGRPRLASEVTTMKFLQTHSDIPVPRIHAFSADAGEGPLSRYLILEYIPGTRLSTIDIQSLDKTKRKTLYESLARILLQLRRLNFPSFGRLYRAGGLELRVSNDILTKDVNVQELEGLDPRKIQQLCYGDRNGLPTAAHYTEALIRTAYNGFFKGADSVDPDMIDSGLYHLDLFRQYAEIWLDPKISPVQFALTHGDFEPHNIIVDAETMAVTGIIDWGWSRVVPIQYFSPPLWLKYPNVTDVAWKHAYDGYISQELKEFLAVVKTEERKKYKSDMLTEQWQRTQHDGGFLIAHALENWRDIDAVAFRYLNSRYYGGTADLEGRMTRFLQDDPLRTLVIQMKEGQARIEAAKDTSSGKGGVVGFLGRFWPGSSAIRGGMMLVTTGVGYGLWRMALASARRPPRI